MAFNTSGSDHEPDPNLHFDPNIRLYNPYKDLNRNVHDLYKLPTTPEYLFEEEKSHLRRTVTENITFYSGSGYLTGSVAGGVSGFFSAVRSMERGDTFKLRVNRVLNSSGHSGRVWGNRLGVIALMYAGIESAVLEVRDEDDVWSSVAAGLATGAVYRAAKGVRSAAVAGALGGLAAGAVVAGKQLAKRYVPI